MEWTMRDLGDLLPGQAVRPEQLALVYIERMFVGYCLTYGMAVALVPRDRMPANAISDVALTIGMSPRATLSSVFLVPAVLMLWHRLRTIGLWTALLAIGVFEVGLTYAAFQGHGTATAPVATCFPLGVAAVLLSLHREARRVRTHTSQPGSSDAGRSSDGTSR